MRFNFQFATDTATLAVFDEVALEHRLDEDRADWWTRASSEFEEANNGNLIIVWLGSDGFYTVDLHDGPLQSEQHKIISANIKCLSGQLYFGPGEYIVGDGTNPSDSDYRQGVFVALAPNTYEMKITKKETFEIEMAINVTTNPAVNKLPESLGKGCAVPFRLD